MAIKYKVSLFDSKRSELTTVTKKHKSTSLKTIRVFVLLACDGQKLSNSEIAST